MSMSHPFTHSLVEFFYSKRHKKTAEIITFTLEQTKVLLRACFAMIQSVARQLPSPIQPFFALCLCFGFAYIVFSQYSGP